MHEWNKQRQRRRQHHQQQRKKLQLKHALRIAIKLWVVALSFSRCPSLVLSIRELIVLRVRRMWDNMFDRWWIERTYQQRYIVWVYNFIFCFVWLLLFRERNGTKVHADIELHYISKQFGRRYHFIHSPIHNNIESTMFTRCVHIDWDKYVSQWTHDRMRGGDAK